MKSSAPKSASSRVVGIKKNTTPNQPKPNAGRETNVASSAQTANIKRNNSPPQQKKGATTGIIGMSEEVTPQTLEIKGFPTHLSSIPQKEYNEPPSQSGLSPIIGQSASEKKQLGVSEFNEAKLNQDLSARIEECIVSSQNILETTLALLRERNHPLKDKLIWIQSQSQLPSQSRGAEYQKLVAELNDQLMNKEKETKLLPSQSNEGKIANTGGSAISRNIQPNSGNIPSQNNQNTPISVTQKATKAADTQKSNQNPTRKPSSPQRGGNLSNQSPTVNKKKETKQISPNPANQRLNRGRDKNENINYYGLNKGYGTRVANTEHSHQVNDDSNMESKTIDVIPASYDRVFEDEQMLEPEKFQQVQSQYQPLHHAEKPKQSQQRSPDKAVAQRNVQSAYASSNGKSNLKSSGELKKKVSPVKQPVESQPSQKQSPSHNRTQGSSEWLTKMQEDVQRRMYDQMQREKLKEELEISQVYDPHKNKRLSPEHINRMWEDATRRHMASQHIQQLKLEEEILQAKLQANKVFNSSPNKNVKSKVKEYIETPARTSHEEESSNQASPSLHVKSRKKSESSSMHSGKNNANENREYSPELQHKQKTQGTSNNKESVSKLQPAQPTGNHRYSPPISTDELQTVQNGQKVKPFSSPKQKSEVQSKVGQAINKGSSQKDTSFTGSGHDRKVQSYMENLLVSLKHKEMFYK